MENKEKAKAKEIAIRLMGGDRNIQPLVDALIEMAKWKDEQFAPKISCGKVLQMRREAYKKGYDKKRMEALTELKQCIRLDTEPATSILRLFPELEESDYVIKKRLTHLLEYFRSRGVDYDVCDRILKWLDKKAMEE